MIYLAFRLPNKELYSLNILKSQPNLQIGFYVSSSADVLYLYIYSCPSCYLHTATCVYLCSQTTDFYCANCNFTFLSKDSYGVLHSLLKLTKIEDWEKLLKEALKYHLFPKASFKILFD